MLEKLANAFTDYMLAAGLVAQFEVCLLLSLTMAHVIVRLTFSFLPTVLDEETAFTRSHSPTEKQVHKFDKQRKDETLPNTTGYRLSIRVQATSALKQNFYIWKEVRRACS